MAITTQPQSQSVLAGATVAFEVLASGSRPSFYQWQKDGTNLFGANASRLTLTNVQMADAGSYLVVISNAFSGAISQPAILTVVNNPNPEEYTFLTLAGLAGSVGSADGTGSAARFNFPSGVAVDLEGNIYVADTGNNTIRKATPAGVVTTLAGLAGSSGSADGTGSAARFYQPLGMAVDSAGNIYMTDSVNNTIRKVTPAGVVTTLAGLAGKYGSADGTGSAARFYQPLGMAVDNSGSIYVADYWNYTIRKVTPVGVVTTLAGLADNYGSADGTGSAARFCRPMGVAVDSTGNVYVADAWNYTIRKVTPAGVVTTLAGLAGSQGSTDGTGSAARFNQPAGVAMDSADNVYVADTSNNTIRKVTPAGAVITLAGLAGSQGSADGTGSAARFFQPSGATVDLAGNIYVADALNHTIRMGIRVGIRAPTITNQPQSQSVLVGATVAFEVSASGTPPMSYQWLKDGTSLSGANAPSLTLTNMQVADAGRYLVIIRDALSVVVSQPAILTVTEPVHYVTNTVTVSSLAGSGVPGYADGNGTSAQFNDPNGGYVDQQGNSYIADTLNNRIRKITREGMVSTLAGTGTSGYFDGPADQAMFNQPLGVCADFQGNVWVADSGNNRIRRISAAGMVSTVAGSGLSGYVDGPGTAAWFNLPNDLAVDGQGNLYVSEFSNHAVRKITPEGMVSTWAGNGAAGYVDGPRAAARFNQPGGIARDRTGNLYVTEWGGQRMRKISVDGQVSTVAGSGVAGYLDALGTAAQFKDPDGIVADAVGNLFIADNGNQVIRRISPTGLVETVAGTGTAGYVEGMGRVAQFANPSGMGLDDAGILYVADWGNHRVRRLEFATNVPPQPVHTVVTVANEAALRAALEAGGTVTLACDGSIALTNTLVITKDVVLDGTGRNVTLDGAGAVRVLLVQPNIRLTVRNLTVTRGRADQGGGLLNHGGSVVIVDSVFHSNQAVGSDADNLAAVGGAVYSIGGEIAATNTLYATNTAIRGHTRVGSPGHEAHGGAIAIQDGVLKLVQCQFTANQAAGGIFDNSGFSQKGDAFGGAVCLENSEGYAGDCHFDYNLAHSPEMYFWADIGGYAQGGAIHQEGGPLLDLRNCGFVGNRAVGGSGGRNGGNGDGQGGAVSTHGVLVADDCTFENNSCVGGGGASFAGGHAFGGALSTAYTATLNHCLFSANQALAGTACYCGGGQRNGNADGGAVYAQGALQILNSTFALNWVAGPEYQFYSPVHGPGKSEGGALFSAAVCVATNSTWFQNRAVAQVSSDNAVEGAVTGAAIYQSGNPLTLAYCTIASNAIVSRPTNTSAAIVLVTNAVARLSACLLSGNTNANLAGSIMDDGFNLSSDHSVFFTAASSRNDVDPKVGQFGDHGSPTPTLALLPDSPAIDAVTSGACPETDQRGVPRPVGARCDIGAFEFVPETVQTQFNYTTNNGAITITKYTGSGGAVTIPSTLDGLPVTGIGASAFFGCSSLTSVTIASSVTSLGDSAFSGCTSLTNLTIPNRVTTIGNDAFAGCTNLAAVTIGTGVAGIGNSAFSGCTSLGGAFFNGNAPSVGSSAFYGANAATVYYLAGTTGWGPTFAGRPTAMWLPYNYAVTNGTITITQYTGSGGGVAIPSTMNGLPVTRIGSSAFSSCASLTSVTIPNSVTGIGEGAFSFCTGLTNVAIRTGVTSIGNSAFSGCTSLMGIYFKGNAPSVGSSVFYGADVATVYYLAGTTGWGSTFAGRPTAVWLTLEPYTYTVTNGTITLTKYTGSGDAVTIPSTIDDLPVTGIGSSAFSRCTGLNSVTISNNVASIGANAFLYCPGLASVTIGTSVTSIGANAFASCTSLASVTIPNSVVSIGDGAFSSCTRLSAITVNALNSVYDSMDGVLFNQSRTTLIQYPAGKSGSYTIPNSVTSIGSCAFLGCTSLPSVTIGDSVTTIGFSAFSSCNRLTSVTIPNGVTNIGVNAFSGCAGLTSVTIGNSVTTIGSYAFYECDSLNSITIPNSVTSIGEGTFWACGRLTKVYFKGNAPSVGLNAFYSVNATVYYVSGTTGWGPTFAERPTAMWLTVEPYICALINGTISIIKYTGFDGTVTIPSMINGLPVTGIGQQAFSSCTGLTSVMIPDSVTSIGQEAFSSCTGLASVTIPGHVTSIGDYAFFSCTSLTSITIGNNVTNIGGYTFSYCTSLTNVVIGNSVTSIGYQAFQSCTRLTNVMIGTNVISIGDGAFRDCTSLTSVTIPNSVTSLGDGAFWFCTSLTSITIGNSVPNIGDMAFLGCTSLTSITLPKNVTSIGYSAFFSCANLREVYFNGNAPSVGSSAFYGADAATVYYLAGTTGWGSTFAGRPTKLWKPQVPPQVETSDASFGVRTNRFGFNITGTSNLVIVVEACADLAHPTWFPLQTNTFSGGSLYFGDPQWTNYPGRYYRLSLP